MILQIPDLYGCIQAPSWASQHFVLIGILSTLGVVALVLLLYHAYTRYYEARKPCWVVALKKLHALSLGSATSLADGKRFYASLTDVLKWYCGKRFGWILSDKTESELIEFFKQSEVDTALLEYLEKCLLTSVQVKFAKGSVAAEQAEVDKQAIISFIEQSIPVRGSR